MAGPAPSIAARHQASRGPAAPDAAAAKPGYKGGLRHKDHAHHGHRNTQQHAARGALMQNEGAADGGVGVGGECGGRVGVGVGGGACGGAGWASQNDGHRRQWPDASRNGKEPPSGGLRGTLPPGRRRRPQLNGACLSAATKMGERKASTLASAQRAVRKAGIQLSRGKRARDWCKRASKRRGVRKHQTAAASPASSDGVESSRRFTPHQITEPYPHTHTHTVPASGSRLTAR